MKRRIATDVAFTGVFTALICVCAWVSVPFAVPFTLQTFAIFLTMGALGGRRGTCAVLCYLFLGAVGLPVFAGFKGGAGALLGATGGYIAGFLFTALIMWAAEVILGKSTPVCAASAAAGLLACYAFGTAWFMAVYANGSGEIGLGAALMLCVVPYIIPDILKLILAMILRKKLLKFVPAPSPLRIRQKKCKPQKNG